MICWNKPIAGIHNRPWPRSVLKTIAYGLDLSKDKPITIGKQWMIPLPQVM